ncbi:MAG: RidA family protein [Burkholderiales bacterium]|jgi:2-iminobutanoate/2-iminopropanoate deaminase|nr:RidA family protein [Burkholderiales bacterium]
MSRQLLRSDKLYTPRYRYTPCVRTGPFYFLSGMIGFDPANGQLVGGGTYCETRQILKLLQLALPDWELTLEHLVQARIFTTRMDQFSEINRAWEEVFNTVDPPARTSIGVAALPAGATVEMEFSLYRA